ncbi:MAG: hypothetical protein KDJ65_20055 [Anaerolineae bacterium]|nr:hypothetical protein [Anaerolineae bacterium]
MVYIALLISVIGLGMAWMCHKKNAALRDKLSETNSRIYNLRRENIDVQENVEKEIMALKFEILKLQGDLKVNPEMKIGEIMTIHPQAQQVLAGFHLGGCSSCSVDDRQSLAEAAAVNGRELEPILAALNTLVAGENGQQAAEPVKVPNIQLHF